MVKHFKKILLTTILLLLNLYGYSQDYGWWNVMHNWDGYTHWHKYIIISPGYMGPNALPVPEIKNGLLSKTSNLKIAFDRHFSSGDNTENFYKELYLPLFTRKVGLSIQMVPIEHYEMNTETRDLRKARDFDGKGFAIGDFYLGTYIQIIEDRKYFPDVLLTINLKTASGNNLSAARFTDTPGYFFDLSFGKEFKLKGSILKSYRPYFMGGFYVWQTFGDGYYQNDSFLYGLGVDLNFSKFALKNHIGGYRGYIGNGDRPMVYRFTLSSKFDSKFNYEFRFQQGIIDINYSTFRVACNINIESIKQFFTKNKKVKENT